MEQNNFEWPPASRGDDPETSKDAEKWMTESGKRMTHAMIVLRVLRENPDGLIPGEISERCPLRHDQVWRRCPDLRAQGLVQLTGEVRRWRGSTQPQRILVPVVKGER